MSGTAPERWLRADGSTVACTESVKVLNENWNEVREALQDMYEDAVLLGCGKAAFKRELHRLVDSLECDYEEQQQPVEARVLKKETP
jgi:hypothetical protein